MTLRLSRLAIAAMPGGYPTGIKGRLTDLPLAPVTILCGPNASGKTTAGPLALDLALFGAADRPNDTARPQLGELPADTLARVELNDGTGWTRDLGAGPNTGETKQSTTAALTLLGALPPALHLSSMLAGSPRDRIAAIVGIARIGGKLAASTVADVRGLVINLHGYGQPDRSGVDPEVWTAYAAEVLTPITVEGDDAIAWLDKAEKLAGPALTAANKAAREAKTDSGKKIEAYEAAKRAVPQAPDTSATDAQIATLTIERDSLIEQRATARQSVEARAEHAGRGTRLEIDVKRATDAGLEAKRRAIADGYLTAAGQPAPEPAADLDGYRSAVATAEAEHAAPVPPPPAVDLTLYGDACTEARRALDAAEDACNTASQRHLDLVAEADEAANLAHEAAQDLAALVTPEARAPIEAHNAHLRALADARIRVDALSGVAATSPCRSCGEPDPHGHASTADEARAALEALEAEREVLATSAEAVAAAIDNADTDYITADREAKDAATAARHSATALSAAHAAVTAAETRLRTTQAALDGAKIRAEQGDSGHAPRIVAERTARFDRARRDLATAEALHTARLDAHRRGLADYEARIVQLRADLTATRAALAEWAALPVPGGDVADPAVRLAEVDREIAAARAAAQAATAAHLAAGQVIERAKTDAEAAVRLADVADARAKSLRVLPIAIARTWVEIARPAVEPIHTMARGIVADAQAALPVPWFDGLAEDGRILLGIERDGRRVHYTDCSGSEKLIAGALLLLAMTAVQGARVPVLVLDELDRLIEPTERQALVACIARAADRGLVANAIITEAGDPTELRDLYATIPGVSVVRAADVCRFVARPGTVARALAAPVDEPVSDGGGGLPF